MIRLQKSLLISLFVTGLVIAGQTLSLPQQAIALSGSQFNAANIIDVGVFFNPNTMNAGDVQSFLNAKLPQCDTQGTQPSSHSGYTRAQWGTANGYPPPYTCLKDYTQSVPSKAPNSYCSGGIAGANKTAAQIIYDVAQACNINPKALIVLLQKEQSLVTDDWPWSIQYRSATGYGCPDTAPCDAEYYGFFNQVYNAAQQFQRYVKQPHLFNFAAGRTSNIQYNPNAACGSSPVTIQNGSTAALYNYTPYQPNAAALANLYGTGDNCSAYGNRNFWRMFSDWFGSTRTNTPYEWDLESFQIYSNAARTQTFSTTTTVAPGGEIYVRVKAVNMGNQTWNKSSVRFGTFRPMQRTSQFANGSWLNQARAADLVEDSVAPGSTGTFEFSLTAPSTPGTYQEYFNIVAENITWFNDLGVNIIVNVVAPVSPSNTHNTSLQSATVLFPKDYLLSPDGQSLLTLQADGNLVLYRNFKPIWDSKTNGKSPEYAAMQADGNFVIYFKNGSTWSTSTFGHSGSYLAMQSDGNVVIYNSGSAAVWSTGTIHSPSLLGYVNNFVNQGVMFARQSMQTADRRYTLVLQTDGNLVLYSPNRAIWSSGTFGTAARYLSMQADGNLVLYDFNGQPVWHTGTNGRGHSQFFVQPDGNLVIYDSRANPSWFSGTFGKE